MHDQRNPRGSLPRNSSLAPAGQDAVVERAALAFVLSIHPDHLTISELAREMVDDLENFAESDAVKRAVHELVSAGLLHRQGDFLLPSRATLYFSQLEFGEMLETGEG